MFEHWYKEVNNQGLYYKSILTVNSILGVPSPITVEKFLKKNCKYNQYDVLQVLSKSSWETFKKFSKLYEPQGLLGICYVTIFGRVVYKKSMIFEVFGAYLSEFLIFLHEILFGSKTLPISCNKHKKFDYDYPRGEAQGPDLDLLFYYFGHFLSCLFRHKPLAYDTDFFMKNQFNVCTLTWSKISCHDIKFWANNQYNVDQASFS